MVNMRCGHTFIPFWYDDVRVIVALHIHLHVHVHTGSPSAPLNLSISNVTNTSVILSWLPPEDGGGRDFSEIYYTITARG